MGLKEYIYLHTLGTKYFNMDTTNPLKMMYVDYIYLSCFERAYILVSFELVEHLRVRIIRVYSIVIVRLVSSNRYVSVNAVKQCNNKHL